MIKIESLDHNGNGITRINNKITFVKRALPGEIVDISIIESKKKFDTAIIKNIIKKSDKRINSKCPYYDHCGGCDLLHINYLEQLKFKQDKINNIISKYLGDYKVNNIVYSNQFNYRNKVTFQVKENIGFYNEKSYKLINIDNCILLNNKINNIIPYLNKLELSNLNKIVVKCFNEELMVVLEGNNINIDILKDKVSSIYLKVNNNYKLLHGKDFLHQSLNNYKFVIGPDSFFQVNIDITIKLYDKIKSYIKPNYNVLDLYCGTGSIGIYTNKNNKTIGIELNKEGIECAKKNNELNNTNINFLCGDASKLIKNINKIYTIIIDPPRSGLTKEGINNIIKINPNNIIYVSCDPMTLVRDLNILKEKYNIIEITPFDMFPNTKHIETIVLLCKKM